MKHIGIVMSAGKGLRAGGDIPKQYRMLLGKPVLYYCLKAMQDSFIDEIIIVSGCGDEEYVKKNIVNAFELTKVTKIVAGGNERQDSVYAGLNAVELTDEETYVYIQDGARPILSLEILNRAKDDVLKYKSAVVGVKSKDTVKISDTEGYVDATPVRAMVWNIQTPQVFEYSLIKNSYECMMSRGDIFVTDDSMVVEQYGNSKVHLTEGDYTNIKITTPEDFEIAERFLKMRGKA